MMDENDSVIGRNFYTSEESLADYWSLYVKASDPNTSEADLRRLAKTEDLIMAGVASNPSTPLDVLEELINYDFCLAHLLNNPKLPRNLYILAAAELRSLDTKAIASD